MSKRKPKPKPLTKVEQQKRVKMRGTVRAQALKVLTQLYVEMGQPVTAVEVFDHLPVSTRKVYRNAAIVGQLFRGLINSGLIKRADHRKGYKGTTYVPADNIAKSNGVKPARKKAKKMTPLIAQLEVSMSPSVLGILTKHATDNGVTPSDLAGVFIQDRLAAL